MLEIKNLKKTYISKGGLVVNAIDDVSLQFEEKGMIFLLGKSGSGKSTMLNTIGGLDKPDSGEIIVKGRNSSEFTQSDFDSYRNTFIGFVFQEYNILDEFTISENIQLALKLQGKPNDKEKVDKLLKQVDLIELGNRKPNTLSGGQKQRVAIARALIKDPEIIMADEPTGALDSNTGEQIFQTLKKLSEKKLVIVVSHDRDFAERFGDRIIELSDGKVISDVSRSETKPEIINDNVCVIDGKTAVIKDVNAINESELKEILKSISKNGKEAVLSAGKEEVKDFKQICGISEKNEQRFFSKTGKLSLKKFNGNATQFIKSKLPISDAFKMGLSGLKVKPLRLAFTILLSVVAFCLFGVMSTLMLYNPSFTMSKALTENNYRSLVTDKNYSYRYDTILVDESGKEIVEKSEEKSGKALYSQQDIDLMNNNNKGLHYIGIFNFSNSSERAEAKTYTVYGPKLTTDYYQFYSVKSLYGFSDCGHDELIRAGATLLAGRYPEGTNEIAISEYIFNMFKDSSNYAYLTPDDIIDKPLNLTGSFNFNFKVSGVYRTSDMSIYNAYKTTPSSKEDRVKRNEMLAELKNNTEKSIDTIGFVSHEFYEFNAGSYISPTYPNVPATITIKGLTAPLYGKQAKDILADTIVSTTQEIYNVYTQKSVECYKNSFEFHNVSGDKIDFSINDNEIFLPQREFVSLETMYNGDLDQISNLNYYVKSYLGNVLEFKIKGYYFQLVTNNAEKFILSDNILNTYSKIKEYKLFSKSTTFSSTENDVYNYVVTQTNNSQAQIGEILSVKGDVFSQIISKEYTSLFNKEILDMIAQFRQIFVIAAVVLGIFAGLMLYNFISASITAKRKEIGILRAVGARGVDVFKIFFSESLVLGAICFVVASILGFITCLIINSKVYTLTNLVFLDYGLKNVLLILVIAIIICFVATFFPVNKEAKKPPVEAIRQL